jgi:hypothetical protein
MQPNPGDTTNALLLYLIQISVNGTHSVPDISNLSPSTELELASSTAWIQMLTYLSLSLSLLAAFGAALGKQWLNSYTEEGRGSLEERSIHRQMKLDGIESFHMQNVVQGCLGLLQTSVLLFVLSLSANMWAKQTTISSVVICPTAFGILFYLGTILVSVLRPDSPFQTPMSVLFAAICSRMLPRKFTLTPNTFTFTTYVKLSAIHWILETSTNREDVDAVAGIVPCVQWPPNFDASTVFKRLRNNFLAYRDREELYLKYGKAMAHLCIQSVKIDEDLLGFYWDNKFRSTQNRFIRDAFMAGRAAYDEFINTQGDDEQKYRASVRTALRTMVVHGGLGQLSRPDEETLIWDGDLRWHDSNEDEPSCEEFDWLVDFLADYTYRDPETEGDALLALSAMGRLGSSTKQLSYINTLIRCMRPWRPPRVRHTALRAVYEAREELASITSASMPQGVDAELMDELSRAIYTAVCPDDDHSGSDAPFLPNRDLRYTRFIGALTQNDEWFQRLTQHGHVDRCISLVNVCPIDGDFDDLYFQYNHLVTLSRIKSSGKDLPFNPSQERWRRFITDAWEYVYYNPNDDDDNMLPDLVTMTRLNLTAPYDAIRIEWLADLAKKVDRIWKEGPSRFGDGIAQPQIDAALTSMRSLYTDLIDILEQWNTSQRDNRAPGS